MLPADDDVTQAVEKKWNGTAGLKDLVPGLLQNGRLSSYQPGNNPPKARLVPYGQMKVGKGQPGMHQTGGPFIDVRRVELKFYGPKADVSRVLKFLRDNAVFNRQGLETEARFMACLQDEVDDLTLDESKKHGEDVWVGTVGLNVWTQRNE